MPLTDAQIERYSRQIIVPRIGGRGQERLLAATMLLSGDLLDLEQPLAYLVGAGVGSIHLATPLNSTPHGQNALADLLKKMRALNPDVTITPTTPHRSLESLPRFDLAMLLLAGDASRDLAATLSAHLPPTAHIIAHLGDSPRLAILPAPATCPRCAHTSLLAPPSPRTAPSPSAPAPDASASAATASPAAAFVAILATTEAFKLLCGFVENPVSVVIDFNGCATRSRSISVSCTCNALDRSTPSS